MLQHKYITYFLLFVLVFSMASCHPDLPSPPQYAPLAFSDLRATDIVAYSANLKVEVSGYSSQTFGFEYWEKGSASKKELRVPISGNTLSGALSELLPSQEYQFRAFAVSGNSQITYSETISFKTLPEEPSVDFPAPEVCEISSNSVLVKSSVPLDMNAQPLQFTIERKDKGNRLTVQAEKVGEYFLAHVDSLEESTQYAVTASYVDASGNGHVSLETEFKTLDANLPFGGINVSSITSSQATLAVTFKEGIDLEKCWFLLRRSDSQQVRQEEVTGSEDRLFVHTYEGLESGTTFQFQVKIQTKEGKEYLSDELTLTTDGVNVTFSEVSVKDVSEHEACLSALLLADGLVASSGFQYWKAESGDTLYVSSALDDSIISSVLTDLEGSTAYGFRALVKDGGGHAYYSQVLSFETSYDCQINGLSAKEVSLGKVAFEFTVEDVEKIRGAWIILKENGSKDSTLVDTYYKSGHFEAVTEGLKEASTFSYKAKVLTDDGKICFSPQKELTTSELVPTFMNLSTYSVLETSVVLWAQISDVENMERMWVTIWENGSDKVTELPLKIEVEGTTSYIAKATGLHGATTYSYQAHVQSRSGRAFHSKVETFRTADIDKTETIKIPDPVFKQYLLSEFDLNLDGEISTLEARAIPAVDTQTEQISSVEGIGFMTGMYLLYLIGSQDNQGGGKLFEIDLSDNPGICHLDLSGNRLKSLDMSAILNCEDVRIGYNYLEEVVFPRSMDNLEIQKNNLKRLDLRGYDALEEVRCEWNPLEELLLDNENLKSINLQGALIKELDLTKCPNLETVDTSHCKLLEKVYVKKGCYIGSLFNREEVHYEVIYVD